MSFESIAMESSEVRKILEGKTKLIIEKLEELAEEKKKRHEYLASELEAEHAAFYEYWEIRKNTKGDTDYLLDCYAGELRLKEEI